MKKEDKNSIRTVIYMTIKGIVEFYRNLYKDYKEERDKINDDISRKKT